MTFIDPVNDTFASGAMRIRCPSSGCNAAVMRRCDAKGVHLERRLLYIHAYSGVKRRATHRLAMVADVVQRHPGFGTRALHRKATCGLALTQFWTWLRRAEQLGIVRSEFLVGSRERPQAGRKAVWFPNPALDLRRADGDDFGGPNA